MKPRVPSAANNGPENLSASDSARSAQEFAGDDATQAEDSNLLRRGVHHVRRGLNRAGVPKIAGHATRISRHGWRRISTAVASANSGGRLTRPVSAVWGRVVRRPADANAPAGDNPHRHRNRRLAFDVAVVTAVIAIFFVVHHQFYLKSHRPRVAELLASSDVVADPAAGEPRPATVTHHRRRTHKSAPPVDRAEAPRDSHAGEPVALADSPRKSDFDDHADVGHRADHPVQPPIDAPAKSAPLDSQPHDSKQAADASLNSLLSTPIGSSAPHGGETAAPMAQTEPPPSREFDKPARPHGAGDPLLVDSREPSASLPSHKHEHIKPSTAAALLVDEFAAPEVAKPHEHHEHSDHWPKDGALKDPAPKDDFSMPAPVNSEPVEPPTAKEDEHHHNHHHADHGPSDQPASGDLPAPAANRDADLLAPKLDAPLPKASAGPSSPGASDPLFDVRPKLDGPQKDAPATKKTDHPDDGLPVLSVPSPHQSDAKLPDNVGPPTRTANANDGTMGGNLDSGKNAPAKSPETRAPAANDASLDDLLNSKPPTPSTGAANPTTSGPPAATSAPGPKPSAPAALPPAASDPKGDPFHTEVAPKADTPLKTDPPKAAPALKTDLPPKADAPPKQAEPSLPEISSPVPKPTADPLHSAADDESMPSVAVAHHQIEKDETGQSVRYKIVVRNNGKKVVKAFEVDEAVPAEHTVQVTDPPAETRDRDLHWTLRDVAPGEERTIVVTFAPPAPLVPSTRPAERLPVAEPTVATQPIPAGAPIEARSEAPQVKLELILPVEVHAGESCRIGFRATNLGAQTTDLKLNLDLPDQLRYARGQQLQYKIGALGDHEAREDYLTATVSGTGQVELRASILHSGHSVATAKGTCRIAPAGAPHRGIQQTGAWTPAAGSARSDRGCGRLFVLAVGGGRDP